MYRVTLFLSHPCIARLHGVGKIIEFVTLLTSAISGCTEKDCIGISARSGCWNIILGCSDRVGELAGSGIVMAHAVCALYAMGKRIAILIERMHPPPVAESNFPFGGKPPKAREPSLWTDRPTTDDRSGRN
jgi:hypothetical protein